MSVRFTNFLILWTLATSFIHQSLKWSKFQLQLINLKKELCKFYNRAPQPTFALPHSIYTLTFTSFSYLEKEFSAIRRTHNSEFPVIIFFVIRIFSARSHIPPHKIVALHALQSWQTVTKVLVCMWRKSLNSYISYLISIQFPFFLQFPNFFCTITVTWLALEYSNRAL